MKMDHGLKCKSEIIKFLDKNIVEKSLRYRARQRVLTDDTKSMIHKRKN